MIKDISQDQPSSYCLPLIRGQYISLRPAEKKAADYILNNPEKVTTMSSVELGQEAGVSESTVVKCCQHLGFAGFSQLKLALVRELATTPESAFGDVELGDTAAQVKDKIFHANTQALSDTARVLDPEALSQAAHAILNAERVHFFGVGASGVVAMDAQLKFMRIGIDSGCYPDSHVQATRAALLSAHDVAVAISHSGQTRDTLEVLELARECGARTICITNHPTSPAAKLSDIVLVTSARETDLRSGALSSRIAQLTVIDCLFMLVAISRHDEAMEAIVKTRSALGGRRRR
ncbi:MAG: MurR/RpiR family transcriptional regulator [Firmicutes bacterium]|nr:MurR/RpiR family transcriptional regulator [Bacillota bacterium]